MAFGDDDCLLVVTMAIGSSLRSHTGTEFWKQRRLCVWEVQENSRLSVFTEFCCEFKDTLKHLLTKNNEKKRFWSETFLDKYIPKKKIYPTLETELSPRQNNLKKYNIKKMESGYIL